MTTLSFDPTSFTSGMSRGLHSFAELRPWVPVQNSSVGTASVFAPYAILNLVGLLPGVGTVSAKVRASISGTAFILSGLAALTFAFIGQTYEAGICAHIAGISLCHNILAGAEYIPFLGTVARVALFGLCTANTVYAAP